MRILDRSLVALATCILVFAAIAPTRANTDGLINVYGWRMGITHSDNGGYMCHMEASYRSGIELGFVLMSDGNGGFTFVNPDWSIPDGARYDVSWRVDRGPWFPGTASQVSGKGVFVWSRSFERHFSLLKRGLVLQIRSGNDYYKFNLTRTMKALPVLSQCVRRGSLAGIMEPSYNGSEPFSRRQPTERRSESGSEAAADARMARLQTLPIAVNLFSAAGIRARFDTEEEVIALGNGISSMVTGTVGHMSFTFDSIGNNSNPRAVLSAVSEGIQRDLCDFTYSEGTTYDKQTNLPQSFSICENGTDEIFSSSFSILRVSSGLYLLILVDWKENRPDQSNSVQNIGTQIRKASYDE